MEAWLYNVQQTPDFWRVMFFIMAVVAFVMSWFAQPAIKKHGRTARRYYQRFFSKRRK